MRELLNQGNLAIHPFIIAELALGSVRDRGKTLALMDLLPQVRVAQLSEVRLTIETRRLNGLEIGLISSPTLLWTRDKRLRQVAQGLGIHAGIA